MASDLYYAPVGNLGALRIERGNPRFTPTNVCVLLVHPVPLPMVVTLPVPVATDTCPGCLPLADTDTVDMSRRPSRDLVPAQSNA